MITMIGSLWIDWQTDGNLLACAGYGDVHIFDKRTNEVAKSVKNLHIGRLLQKEEAISNIDKIM